MKNLRERMLPAEILVIFCFTPEKTGYRLGRNLNAFILSFLIER